MLAIAIFFVAGIALGLIGLRLLEAWEGLPLFHRHHDSTRGRHS